MLTMFVPSGIILSKKTTLAKAMFRSQRAKTLRAENTIAGGHSFDVQHEVAGERRDVRLTHRQAEGIVLPGKHHTKCIHSNSFKHSCKF